MKNIKKYASIIIYQLGAMGLSTSVIFLLIDFLKDLEISSGLNISITENQLAAASFLISFIIGSTLPKKQEYRASVDIKSTTQDVWNFITDPNHNSILNPPAKVEIINTAKNVSDIIQYKIHYEGMNTFVKEIKKAFPHTYEVECYEFWTFEPEEKTQQKFISNNSGCLNFSTKSHEIYSIKQINGFVQLSSVVQIYEHKGPFMRFLGFFLAKINNPASSFLLKTKKYLEK